MVTAFCMPIRPMSAALGISSSMLRMPEKLVDSMTSMLPPPSIPIYRMMMALLSIITSEMHPK